MRQAIETGRNPFARHTIRKHKTSGTCDWCGSVNGKGHVWQYTVDPDTGAIADIKGQFCNIECLNDYYR